MTKPEPTPNATDLASLLGFDEPQIENVPAVIEDEPEEPEELYTARKKGRPKGSVALRKQATKSSVMQQRLALEAGIRDYISHPSRLQILRDAIDRTLRIAAYGLEDKDSVRAFHTLVEKLVQSPRQEEEANGAAPPQVHIVIENATVRPALKAIDAEFTEVKRE